MAGVLQLTDGTLTVDLLDTTALFLSRQGWQQSVAVRDPTGVYEDVTEVMKLAWVETEDDSRATTLHTLGQLKYRAERYVEDQEIKGEVWLEASTHSETNSKYAIVKKISFQELSDRHWGADGALELTITIVREGLWKDTEPGSRPTAAISAVTVYNKQDADGDNFVTVATADSPGSAPGVSIMQLDTTGAAGEIADFLIALKTGSTADLNNFQSHFNAVDELDNAASQVADTNAAGDIRLDLTGSSDTTLRWTIPDELAPFEGRYQAYVVARRDSGGGGTALQVRFSHGDSQDDGELVQVTNTTSYERIFLGRFNIPAGGFIPDLAAVTAGTYEVRVDVVKNAQSATLEFYELFLVPDDEAVFRVRNIQGKNVIDIDGILERSYERLTTSGAPTQSGGIIPNGTYIQLEPGTNNRLYFYAMRANNVVFPNDNLPVTIYAVNRYLALIGNT